MSNGRQHGGDWALLGFYYQILATLGVGTLRSESVPTPGVDTFSLLVTFTSDKEMILTSEEGGEDITLLAGNQLILFQCKHSSSPAGALLDMSGFREVLKGFAHSLLHAEKSQMPMVCGCILLTNRLPHAAIAEIKSIIHQCRVALGFQNSQFNPVPPETAAYRALPIKFNNQKHPFQGNMRDLVSNWLSDKDKHGEITKLPENDILQAALRVLPAIYFLTDIHQLQIEEMFKSFANRYGATPKEAEDAITNMVGKVLRASGHSITLTLEDFRTAIAGRSDGREMTPAGIRNPCAESWQRWVDDRGARPEWITPRPTIQNKISQAFLEGKRIVFLVGSGGCGKTEAMLELTAQKINQFEAESDFPGFVALRGCPEMKNDWLETTVGEWANRGELSYQTVTIPLARLSIANPNLPLILLIGLDGLDENFPSRDTLDSLIKETRKRNDLYLIMTVRGNEYKDFSHFIHRHRIAPPFNTPELDIGIVPVGEFGGEELLAVLASGISQDLSDEVREYLPQHDGSADTSFATMASGYGREAESAAGDYSLVHSLKHPRMLGAFILAEKQSPGTAHKALYGDNVAQNRVAYVFIHHFLGKYSHRRKDKELPPVYEFATLIKEVAANTLTNSVIRMETIWTDAAAQTGVMSRSKAAQLFDEAASGGLILIVDETASSREWEWRHPIVADYLSNTSVREFCPNE